jgi:hypothetical protein
MPWRHWVFRFTCSSSYDLWLKQQLQLENSNLSKWEATVGHCRVRDEDWRWISNLYKTKGQTKHALIILPVSYFKIQTHTKRKRQVPFPHTKVVVWYRNRIGEDDAKLVSLLMLLVSIPHKNLDAAGRRPLFERNIPRRMMPPGTWDLSRSTWKTSQDLYLDGLGPQI